MNQSNFGWKNTVNNVTININGNSIVKKSSILIFIILFIGFIFRNEIYFHIFNLF